jgi:hypothetical protein
MVRAASGLRNVVPITSLETIMTKAHFNTALIALAAFAAVTLVQSYYQIPVVGKYLPGAK